MNSSNRINEHQELRHRILIVDDDADIRDALADTIEILDEYVTQSAHNEKEALRVLDEFNPDLILLDINLGSSSGLDLLPIIKQKSPNTIVVIMTAYRDNKYTIKALKNGADDYLLKPLNIELLLPQLESYLHKRQSIITNQKTIHNLQVLLEQTNKLLFLLDHNGSLVETTNTALHLINCERINVIGLHFEDTPWWAEAPEAIESINKALVIAKKGEYAHTELCIYINNHEMHLDVTIKPIINDAGIIDFFIVDSHDITERVQMETSLRIMAQHDVLTGLANRSLFNEHLSLTEAQASRNDSRFAILFIDLDNFKLLNDKFGHDAGDDFLVTASKSMNAVLRDADILARLGGDEFAAILTSISNDFDPEIIARRILDAIQKTSLSLNTNLSISASIGISIYPDHGTNPAKLVKMADEAMYLAKKSGKNTIKQFTSIGQNK